MLLQIALLVVVLKVSTLSRGFFATFILIFSYFISGFSVRNKNYV